MKFYLKNKEKIDRLNQFIDENKDNIVAIVASCELFELLKELSDTELQITKVKRSSEPEFHDEEFMRYKRKIVIINKYSRADSLGFVMKNNRMDFQLPCVGGYYNDEKHP
jgi:hypothetical protein